MHTPVEGKVCVCVTVMVANEAVRENDSESRRGYGENSTEFCNWWSLYSHHPVIIVLCRLLAMFLLRTSSRRRPQPCNALLGPNGLPSRWPGHGSSFSSMSVRFFGCCFISAPWTVFAWVGAGRFALLFFFFGCAPRWLPIRTTSVFSPVLPCPSLRGRFL